MRQIPRSILIHSAVFYKRTGTNEYSEPAYAEGVTINFVRCEPVKQSSMKSLGEMKDDSMIMFYDYKNSSPAGIKFSELDRIDFNGKQYTVRKAQNYFDHHYELYLK